MKFTVVWLTCSLLSMASVASAQETDIERHLAALVEPDGLSELLDVFLVDAEKPYMVGDQQHTIGAGFQPSVVLDDQGTIHLFFRHVSAARATDCPS